MALLQPAIEYTLKLEDSTLSGIISDTAGDKGGVTRFGISKVSHPELAVEGFFGPMPKIDALFRASQVYDLAYASPMQVTGISDQSLANVFLAFGVNAGTKTAIQAMQRAVNDVLRTPPLIAEDGIMGPHTQSQIERCMPNSLLNAFRLQMIRHYLACNQPKFLEGWIRRALA